MKRNLLLLWLSLAAVQPVLANPCRQSVGYVSDFDDTIKAYSSGSQKGEKLRERLFGKKRYPGVDTLLNAARAQCPKNRLSILTAAPNALEKNVTGTLKNGVDIQHDEVIYRESLKEETPVYKSRVLEDLMFRSEQDAHVFIGDNTRADPEVYLAAKTKRPHKVAAIYIHRRESKKLSSSDIIPFHLYLEVAINEHLEGRLDRKALDQVAEDTLKADMNELFPPNHECPLGFKFKKTRDTAFNRKIAPLEKSIHEFCSKRKQNHGSSGSTDPDSSRQRH